MRTRAIVVALAALWLAGCSNSESAAPSTALPASTTSASSAASSSMTETEACWLFNRAWHAMPDRLTLEAQLIKQGIADKASLDRLNKTVDESLAQIHSVKPYLPHATADLVPRIAKDWTAASSDFVRIGDKPDWLTNPQVLKSASDNLASGADIDAVGALLRTSGCAT